MEIFTIFLSYMNNPVRYRHTKRLEIVINVLNDCKDEYKIATVNQVPHYKYENSR